MKVNSKECIYNITELEPEEACQIDLALNERLEGLKEWKGKSETYKEHIEESINIIEKLLNSLKKAKEGRC